MKSPNKNVNNAVMTAEVSIWKKEFTFWNTDDGKVI